MVTKRQLGIGYLLGTGVGLLCSLVGYLFLTAGPAITNVVGTVIASMLAGSLLYAGVWLRRSGLPEDLVWNIAKWSAVGLSIPTGIGVLLTIVQVQAQVLYLFPTLFVNTIAAGGVIGVLLGSVNELRKEHEKTLELNRKNLVMNRVLRHNIRNDMNIILGQIDRLNGHNGIDDSVIQPIKQKINDVVSLSESARRIETIGQESDQGPVDVVSLIENQLRVARASYPDASISARLPSVAWARGDSLLSSAIDNLIENAVKHTDTDPVIDVSVERKGTDVVVRVADSGPGIPEREKEVLLGDRETSLTHSEGLGLWLVKWVIESYDGEIRFESNDPQGSVVELRLPACRRPDNLAGAADGHGVE